MVVVLIVAAGAAWESTALGLLGDRAGIVVLKRCVDVDDLLAAASAGQADVAVLGLDAPGLDVAAVDHLRSYGVRPVAIVPGGAALDAACLRATRIGIRSLVAEDELESLPDAVAAGEEPADTVVRAGRAGRRRRVAGPRPWPGAWSRSGARPARPAAPRSPPVWPPSWPGGRSRRSWSTPTPTAAPSPSSSASSTRSPACCPRPG